MRRRQFLKSSRLTLASLLAAQQLRASPLTGSWSQSEFEADLVILGGGLGGCAAALAALRLGKSVLITEPTDWIGGQLTSQAVPPDEHPWIEQFGCNASYAQLRDRIRERLRRDYPLTAAAFRDPILNPGNGGVSGLCVEPRIALGALSALLAPFASMGRLTILLEHEPIAAETQGDCVPSVLVRDLQRDDTRVLTAPYIVDATELGDLLDLAKIEHTTGFESQSETGDRGALSVAEPLNQQAFTLCFPIEYRPEEDHTIDRPENYQFWRDYVPNLTPPWPGPLLSLTYSNPRTLEPRFYGFDPTGAGAGFWRYRRIIDPRNFESAAFEGSNGVTLVNWPQNDYLIGPLIGVSNEEKGKLLKGAKELNRSLLYWLQTECPRPDGGIGWPGLRLRPDLVGTDDGMAKAPYVRESRRIRAEFTVLEEHVGTESRREAVGKNEVEAVRFPDSVGVGSYRIDLHPSTGGNNYIDVSSLPFQIPLGALLPIRVENVIPACKNIGTTHITNGCYRLHPVEWAIGEAAGTLAAYCIERQLKPRAVRNNDAELERFQALLRRQGVEINWPKVGPR